MPLPISPEPHPDETLGAYLQRAAELNLKHPRDLGWTQRDHTLRHGHIDWNELSATTGEDADTLRDLTPFRYPRALVGGQRPGVRRRVWRIPAQHRRCSSCHPTIWKRDWELALTLCCPDHRQLLRPATDHTAYPEIPIDDALLNTQAEITGHLASFEDQRARARLSRLHRFVRIASLTADTEWPVVSSPYLADLRRIEGWRRQVWSTTRTPTDPVQIALLVTACWPWTATERQQRPFLTVAWDRLHARSIELTAVEQRSLPDIPPLRPPRLRTQSTERPKAIRDAAQDLADAGRQPRHLPLLLLPPETTVPDGHELASTHHHARLLATALAETTGTTADLPRAGGLRLGPTVSSHRPPRPTVVRRHVEELLAGPPVDYAERRAVLTHLPRSAPAGITHPWPLAKAWIWAHLTRSPLRTGIHQVRLMDLRAFDRNLDPEQRLRLHEIGLEHLAATDDLTATTATPRTRRSGGADWVEVS